MKTELAQQLFIQFFNIKFNQNYFLHSQVVLCLQTAGQSNFNWWPKGMLMPPDKTKFSFITTININFYYTVSFWTHTETLNCILQNPVNCKIWKRPELSLSLPRSPPLWRTGWIIYSIYLKVRKIYLFLFKYVFKTEGHLKITYEVKEVSLYSDSLCG
jgi:hypothetical protein